jgi:hypothetical protein
MKKNFTALMTICLLTVICQNVSAVLIVDTGLPADEWGWGVADKYGMYQSLAAEFTISSPGYAITDIEGYFYVSSGAGNVSIEIAGDGGDNPSSATLYSGTCFVNDRAWFGLHNITGFNLNAGTYWVVFKPTPNMGVGMPTHAPNGLGNEAFMSPAGTAWQGNDSLNLGIRISGQVPEPTTIALLMIGAMFLRRAK